jgi:hypothetical protein
VTIRRRLAAAGAAAASAALIALTAPAAGAATPQCGSGCAALYNLIYGNSKVIGAADASGTRAFQGEFAFLTTASSSNQAEDWALEDEGTVSDFYAASLVSAGLNLHYGNDEVYEYEYVPYGVGSGLCLGVPGHASNGTVVSLQPCGESAQTLWVYDAADQYQRQVPFISGLDTNFAYPEVLTADSAGVNLSVHELTGGNGVIDDGQYWSSEFGVLGS